MLSDGAQANSTLPFPLVTVVVLEIVQVVPFNEVKIRPPPLSVELNGFAFVPIQIRLLALISMSEATKLFVVLGTTGNT